MIEFSPQSTDAASAEASIVGAVTADDAEAFVPYVESHRLVLNVFRGWDGDLESVAKAFANIPVKRLSLFGSSTLSVDSLLAFSLLDELHVAGLVQGALDLDGFPRLKVFGFGAELKGKVKVALTWGSCLELRKYVGLASKLPSFEMLRSMPKLMALSVVKPDWEPDEVQTLAGLTEIDFSYWRKITDLRQLGDLLGRLERLELYQASKIQDYSALSSMPRLRRLRLEKCPALPSVKLLGAMTQLEDLFLIDTKIDDGDLSHLFDLPRLRRIAMMDQKHYVPKRDEICEQIESRSES